MEMFTFLCRICNAIAMSLFCVFIVMVVFVQLLEPQLVFFVFLSVEMVVMLSARLHVVTSALPSGYFYLESLVAAFIFFVNRYLISNFVDL